MTSILHPRTDDRAALAAAIPGTVAQRMWLRPESVAQSFALSTWTTIEEMIEREFAGAYRGYYPKANMELRAEAVMGSFAGGGGELRFRAPAVLSGEQDVAPIRAARRGREARDWTAGRRR